MSWFSSLLSRSADVPPPDRQRDLVLYAYDTCGYCQRVYRKVAATGLKDEVRVRNVWEERAARRELSEATGRTQVPCLFVDGVPLFESLDIVDWLDGYAKWRAGRQEGPTSEPPAESLAPADDRGDHEAGVVTGRIENSTGTR